MPSGVMTARPRGAGDARGRLLGVLLAVITILAWAALAGWSASPYARYLGHGGWADASAWSALCAAVPAGGALAPPLAHAFAWVLMIAAMMLPTTYPLLALFRRLVAGRPDATVLLAWVVAGFLGVWLAFGLAAHLLDAGVQWAVGRSPAMATHGPLIGAGILAAAGLFQWSSLKYRCLEACHSPFTFVAARWRGRDGRGGRTLRHRGARRGGGLGAALRRGARRGRFLGRAHRDREPHAARDHQGAREHERDPRPSAHGECASWVSQR